MQTVAVGLRKVAEGTAGLSDDSPTDARLRDRLEWAATSLELVEASGVYMVAPNHVHSGPMTNTRGAGKGSPNGPLRCLSYGRVSTGRQAEQGLSLGDQEESLATEVARRGWEHVAHVTDAGLSGRKLANRRGLLAALDRLDDGEADVLLASKVDRVARSTGDFAGLLDRAERHGWKVCVLDVEVDTTSSAGRMVAEIVAAAAAFESRRIGERVRAAHAVRKAQGKRAGQAPVLPEAIRLRIAAEHAAGRSLRAITRDLNAEGVPTAMGGQWHPSTVSHVVKSVALDGELAGHDKGGHQ